MPVSDNFQNGVLKMVAVAVFVLVLVLFIGTFGWIIALHYGTLTAVEAFVWLAVACVCAYVVIRRHYEHES